MAQTPILTASLLIIFTSQVAHAQTPSSIKDLEGQYDNIFKTGNRNAASHLWSSYIFKQSQDLNASTLEHLFTGFCPVSGSPLPDTPNTAFAVTLPKVGGGTQTGVVRHCCWPCSCDLRDSVQVDTADVITKDGPSTYHVLVIGNPCIHPEKLSETWKDSDGRTVSLRHVAPEVQCDGGKLRGAVASSHGHPIIGLFDARSGAISRSANQASKFNAVCAQRRAEGYTSGMGLIFLKVAGIAPLPAGNATLSEIHASKGYLRRRGSRRTSSLLVSDTAPASGDMDCRMRSADSLRCKVEH